MSGERPVPLGRVVEENGNGPRRCHEYYHPDDVPESERNKVCIVNGWTGIEARITREVIRPHKTFLVQDSKTR